MWENSQFRVMAEAYSEDTTQWKRRPWQTSTCTWKQLKNDLRESGPTAVIKQRLTAEQWNNRQIKAEWTGKKAAMASSLVALIATHPPQSGLFLQQNLPASTHRLPIQSRSLSSNIKHPLIHSFLPSLQIQPQPRLPRPLEKASELNSLLLV